VPLKSVFRSSPGSSNPARQNKKWMGGAGKLRHHSLISVFVPFNPEQAALKEKLSQFLRYWHVVEAFLENQWKHFCKCVC